MTQKAGRRGRTGPRVPGVILDVNRRRATVLAEGRFLRVAAMPGWESGGEVWVVLPPGGGPSARLRGIVLAAAGAAVAVGAVVFGLSAVASAQVAALVSVDINPSVQLGVDSSGLVLSATAMDADARRILGPGGLRHKALSTAIAVIVRRAVADGLLPAPPTDAAITVPGQGDGRTGGAQISSGTHSWPSAPPTASEQQTGAVAVIITAAPVHGGGTALPPAVAREIAAAPADLSAMLASHGLPATVDVVSGDQALVGQAHSSGLSIGEQVFYDGLRGAGVPVRAATFRHASLPQALNDAGIPKADVPTVVHAFARGGADSPTTDAVIAAARRGEGPTALQQLLRGKGARGNPPRAAASQRGGEVGGGSAGGTQITSAASADQGRHAPGGGAGESGGGARQGAPVAAVATRPVRAVPQPPSARGGTNGQGGGTASASATSPRSSPGLWRRFQRWLSAHPQHSGGDSGKRDNNRRRVRPGSAHGAGSGGDGAAVSALRPAGAQRAAGKATGAGGGGAVGPSGPAAPSDGGRAQTGP